ncbi:hypothetical protein [Sediminicoccus sp. KRV36]|uniref:hypothetical protein n=1 Tax=Sediminicoccus sp. KRV36 TaxID=3133721 RepID=UPI00200E21AC|nr:hypothetical protein [Sediminicoccus rosea]UPY37218.1 hypothetical protein LHU95_00560 [Sediminicoccus rosea]
MLKLNLKPEPTWLEIGGGLRVKVPPLDTAILRAVEYQAFQAYAAMKSVANAGDDTVTLDTVAVARLEGAYALARTRALADQIMDWEGIGGEDGSALAPAGAALDAFAAHPMAGPAFARAYEATVGPLLAEGNGSGNSLPGDGAGATATAPDASPAGTGDAAVAPPSATPRKAAKA